MLQFIAQRNQIGLKGLVAALALFILLPGATRASAQRFTPERDMLNRLVQGASGNDPATKAFIQGRDLINEEKWDGAAATFSKFVNDYPSDKNTDAALYWLAYAYDRQSKLAEAETALARLIQQHPRSSWVRDARTLLLKVRAKRDPQNIVMPDGENDELIIIALQALCQNDRPRCPSLVNDRLRSNASPRVKEAAITLLGRYGGNEAVPALIQLARSESNEKLRMRAIAALGETNDERVLDVLREIAMSANYADESPTDSAIHALVNHDSPRAVGIISDVIINGKNLTARQHAVSLFSRRAGEPVVDELLRIYDAVPDVQVRKYVVAAFGNRKSPRAGAKLAEIARTSTDVELRKQAIHSIPNRDDAQSLDVLLSLYDGESNVELKSYLLEAFSRYDDKRALQKLMQVVRNTSEPLERRKRAINALSRSKDPEVIQFLVDMLK
jgi:HEAT repeat protein